MIYLDNHATTPCDPRVVDAMLPYFSKNYGNPSSGFHRMGRSAKGAVEKARAQVAGLIGAQPGKIIFTGSATESNNIAILGLQELSNRINRKQICLSAIEHKSVISPCRFLESKAFKVNTIPVDNLGRVMINAYRALLNEHALLVSVQAANNEIGTIQDVAALCKCAHDKGSLFHCDAVQAAGKIPVDVETLGVDLLSISAHKMYGPKGVAALYIRGGVSQAALSPIMLGGDQESGLRPGTLNVPLIVGFGEACRLAGELMKDEAIRMAKMRDDIESALLATIPGLSRNGDISNRLPNNSSLTFPGIDAEALIMSMPELALSTGAACNSGAQEPSYVLKAIGLSHDVANCTLRIGTGRFNQSSEKEIIVTTMAQSIKRLL